MFINLVGWLFFLLALAIYPHFVLAAMGLGLVVGWLLRRTQPSPAPTVREQTTPNGLPILNEDWVGEEVLSIDDARIPPTIQAHGARFRNPARYVIEVGPGEYVLYGADGELLDLCCLK